MAASGIKHRMSVDPRSRLLCSAVAGLGLLATSPASAQAVSQPLTLEKAITLALAHNEIAQGAEQRVRAASARVDKARSFFLPDITLEGSYTRLARGSSVVGRPREYDQLGGRLSLDIVLFNGRGFPLYRQAELEHEASQLERTEQKRLLAFDTAVLFLASIGQEQVRAAAERRVELANTSVKEARARLEAGLASSNDLTQVELELAAAERTLIAADTQLADLRLDLGYTLGGELEAQALERPAQILDAAQAMSTAPSPALPTLSALPRLNLQALQKRAEALDASAEEPLWRWVPTLALTAESHAAFELPENPDASVGVKLTWSLWDGGERSADRDERLALAKVGQLDLAASSRRAHVEAQKAMVTLARGQRTAETAQRASTIARKNSQETAELYRQGLATALQVADAGQRLFEAEVELTQAHFEMGTGLLDLRAALGLDPFGKEIP